MALETNAPLENQYRLFTAVGFGMEKANADTLLDSARQAAYSGPIERDATIKMNDSGDAIVNAAVNGKPANEATISYSNSKKQVFPLGKSYDVEMNQDGNKTDGHVLLTMGLMSGETGFHIKTDNKQIDGTCSVKDGQTACSETIKDAQGNLVLRAESRSNINTSPKNFKDSTDYYDSANKLLGHVDLTVSYDENNNTVKAHSALTDAK